MGLKFVVGGTGRSGTGYIATLFNAAGVRCGHEEVFTEKPGWRDLSFSRNGIWSKFKEPFGRLREESRRRQTTFDGDASWMAVPRFSYLTCKKFLQVRHPLKVISSFTGTRFFSRSERKTQNLYSEAFMCVSGNDVVDAMRWWVMWNRLALDHADLVYKLEDFDVGLFESMLSMIGVRNAGTVAEAAVASIPVNVNAERANTNARKELSWDGLPSCPERDELFALAKEFGYL